MGRELNRRKVLGGIVAGSGLALAGCLDGNGAAEDADAMVGTLSPTTGDLGDLGGPIEDAAVLPGTQLEDEGSDFVIDIRSEDTETDPEAGITAAQSLVDAGYPAITGAAASNVTIAVAEDIFIPDEVVAISPASTSPAITDMNGDFLLRTAPSDALQGDVMASIAYEEEGLETMSTFFLNDDYGQGLSDAAVENFEALGGEVYEEVAFEPEQPSYDSELESALGDDPDLLIVVGFPDSGEQIFRDYYDNFDGDHTIMVPDGLQENSLPGNVDNPMENVMGTAPGADGPESDAFVELYEDEYGTGPGVFNAQAYDATAVHILAQLSADDPSGSALSEQVRAVSDPGGEVVGPSNLADAVEMAADGEEIEYQGASGLVQFDDNGDVTAATYDVFEFDMDGYTVTETIEFEAEE